MNRLYLSTPLPACYDGEDDSPPGKVEFTPDQQEVLNRELAAYRRKYQGRIDKMQKALDEANAEIATGSFKTSDSLI